ncbi:MAG TPA: zf-HC2 domain-containing protein [Gemmatimonadales bacterium]|nr:zf-HC2 domain-containing protein [Gemmatimonadales bacterium]
MTDHLSAADVAAHLDGVLPPTELARVDQHLAECDECRAELIALAQLLRTQPRRRRWVIPASLAAAAVVALVIIGPRLSQEPPSYREPAVSTTPAPIAVAPRGPSAIPIRLIWTRVPHAERYRLTVFDSTGLAIWESQTTDTAIALPGTVRLRPRVAYFWQVEAQTAWNRWIRSDLVEFTRP